MDRNSHRSWTLWILLILFLSLAGCSRGGASRQPVAAAPPPQAPVNPAPEDLEVRVLFWLGRPRLAPAPASWRQQLADEGPPLLRSIYGDVTKAANIRGEALAALGHFEEPWISDLLREGLANTDLPVTVRARVGQALADHLGTEALPTLESLIRDPEADLELRRRIPAIVASLEGGAARELLEKVDGGEHPDLLARAIDRALVEHRKTVARLELARRIQVEVACPAPTFTPASPEEMKVGVPGPDFYGRWRNAAITVALSSSATESLKLRLEFDPLELGLVFVDPPSAGVELGTELVTLEPGESTFITSRIEIKSPRPVETEVWVYSLTMDRPLARVPCRIEPAPRDRGE